MKSLPIALLATFFAFMMLFATSCSKKSSCPAYNTTHNSKDYATNPNNASVGPESAKDNKADIEKRREAELKGGKSKKHKSYGLFPKWMKIKSH